MARKVDDSDVLGLVDRILASGEGVLSGEYRGGYRPPGIPLRFKTGHPNDLIPHAQFYRNS